MNESSRKRGFFLVIIGAFLWGVGGTVSQKLFQQYAVDVDWLVTTRLLIAGVLLLVVQFFKKGRSQISDVWKNRRNAFRLVIFGLFGMLAVQYTYMASIEAGNAAVATLLQYMAPILIIFYIIIRKQAILMWHDVVTVALAVTGCFLLLTNGSLSGLSVPMSAIVWGVLSALTLAFYTLYAVILLKHFDSLVIVGWSMIIGGVALSFVHPPWQMDYASLSAEAYGYLLFVILFGTMIAFWFYFESLQSLSPKETSLLGTVEPLAAVFTTVLWLQEPFGSFQWVGTFCIIGMIALLALNQKSSVKRTKEIVAGQNED